MSKAFRYFFRKKDRKDGEINRHPNKEKPRGPIHVEAVRDDLVTRDVERKHSSIRRRTSDSISRDPIYLNRLFGISNEGSIRLFKEEPLEEHNLPQKIPDTRPKYEGKGKNLTKSFNRNNMNNVQVYTASVTRNSLSFNPPRSSRPSEPFPYKVYDSAPRRSTLYYGVDYDGEPLHSDEQPRPSKRNSVDYNAVPSTSQSEGFKYSDLQNIQDNEEKLVQRRRVTVVTPNEMGDIPPMNSYESPTNDLETEPVRKTVLRFRPNSSAGRQPRESVKLMVFRADQIEPPPMFLSRHVHQFPLKRIKRTPLLMTDDGRVLKPLNTDKQARNSLSVTEEESRVRLSLADIENMCKVPRKSTEIIDPVLHSRNSINRSSIRQSVTSRQIVNENRSSILRENGEEPKISYHYSLEENKPMVYDVPIPSRNRSHSQLSRQSVTSYDHTKYERHSNDDSTLYYVDDSKPTDRELRYSRGSYQQDSITTKKDKPIVVYEVHNVENKNPSISKDSFKKENNGNVYTKPQRHSAQKSSVPNPPINSQVEIVYKESKPQIRPTKKKSSFRNSISIQKSSENYMNGSGPLYQQQPVVYVAEVPSATLPASNHATRNFPLNKKRSRTLYSTTEKRKSNDFCGLTVEPHEKKTTSVKTHTNSNFKVTPSFQQTYFENDIDSLCYPNDIDSLCYPDENQLKAPTSVTPDPKLKWKVIIKK